VEHPKAIGDRTTLAVMLALREAGYSIAVPFGENTRYDLLIDDGTVISRVQCKTGRLRNGSVRFATCSSYAHHPNPQTYHRDYVGEVDYFGAPRQRASLRIDPPRNNQRRRIRFAEDYEVGAVTTVTGTRCNALFE
jgi:PD-(D/E)XK endonuclease